MRKLVVALMLVSMLGVFSCKHDIYIDPNQTVPVDTTWYGIACDPDSVYFNQVLPIIIANCTMAGCHEAGGNDEANDLTTYAAIVHSGYVRPFDGADSKLYKSLIDNDPDERMPQGAAPLPSAQISMIRTWIDQGALNNACDPYAGANCDTTHITYTADISLILNAKCRGCHNINNAQGGYELDSYSGARAVGFSGKLVSVVLHLGGVRSMPPGGASLPPCEINKIKAWVNQGMLEN